MTVFKSTVMAGLALAWGTDALAQTAPLQPGELTDITLQGGRRTQVATPTTPAPQPPVAQQPAQQPQQGYAPQYQLAQPQLGNSLATGGNPYNPFPGGAATARCPSPEIDPHCVQPVVDAIARPRLLNLRVGTSLGLDHMPAPGGGVRMDPLMASFQIVNNFRLADRARFSAGDVGIEWIDGNNLRMHFALADGQYLLPVWNDRLGIQAQLVNGHWNIVTPGNLPHTSALDIFKAGVFINLLNRGGLSADRTRPSSLQVSVTAGWTVSEVLNNRATETLTQHFVPFTVGVRGRHRIASLRNVLEVYGGLALSAGPAVLPIPRGTTTEAGLSLEANAGVNVYLRPRYLRPRDPTNPNTTPGVAELQWFGLEVGTMVANRPGLLANPATSSVSGYVPGALGNTYLSLMYNISFRPL